MPSQMAWLKCSRMYVAAAIAETVRKALSSIINPSLLGLLSSQARRNSPLKLSLKVVGQNATYAPQPRVPSVFKVPCSRRNLRCKDPMLEGIS